MITYGTDPELAYVSRIDGSIIPFGTVVNEVKSILNREVIPGHDVKGDRILIEGKNSLYVDGASLELNVKPSSSTEVVIQNLRRTLRVAAQIARFTNYKLVVNPSIPINSQQIENGGVALTVFGCDPDESIYLDKVDPATIDAKLCFYRYFGGHLHSSKRNIARGDYNKILWYAKNIHHIVLAHDLLVGTSDVILSQEFNEECKIRRNVYGRAGRYRIQPYGGMEYRTPSNLWLNSPELARFMFNMVKLTNSLIDLPNLIDKISNDINMKELFEVINNCDVKNSYHILDYVIGQMKNSIPMQEFKIPVLHRDNSIVINWRV